VRSRLYLIALERGFLDNIIDRVIVEPFVQIATHLSRLDRWLCNAVVLASPTTVEATEDSDE
jgi:hypothetical protein